MKKSIALVAMAFGVTSAFAQDLTSKKGEPILPEAGDYAISIDATPFLNYAGNFFGKTNNNVAPTFDFFTKNQTITGKMFKDANTAYRASLNIGFGGPSVKQNVTALPTTTATVYPATAPVVENKWKQSNTKFGVSVGLEKRRGKTRLQGVYGADLGIWFASTKNKFTYGNTLADNTVAASAVNVTAADGFSGFAVGTTTANANYNAAPPIVGVNGSGARMTEMKSGATISFGVRAFVGAEYFIMPKISIGGEFGWGIGYMMTGKSKTTWESVGQVSTKPNSEVGSTTIEGGKTSSFVLGTDNNSGSVFGPSGALRLSLHF
jgi:hypothetical protein